MRLNYFQIGNMNICLGYFLQICIQNKMFAFVVSLPYFAKFWIASSPDIKTWLEISEFISKAGLGWEAGIGDNVGIDLSK